MARAKRKVEKEFMCTVTCLSDVHVSKFTAKDATDAALKAALWAADNLKMNPSKTNISVEECK